MKESRRDTQKSEIFSPGRGSPKRKKLRDNNDRNQDRSTNRKGTTKTEYNTKQKKSQMIRDVSKNELSQSESASQHSSEINQSKQTKNRQTWSSNNNEQLTAQAQPSQLLQSGYNTQSVPLLGQ